jgi:hypothetical protein
MITAMMHRIRATLGFLVPIHAATLGLSKTRLGASEPATTSDAMSGYPMRSAMLPNALEECGAIWKKNWQIMNTR